MRRKICYFYALRAPAWFSATWSGLSAPFREPGPRRGGPCSCPRPASCTAPLSPAHLRMYSDPHPARAVAGSWAGGGGGQGEPWPPSVQCWRERSEPSRVCPGAGDSRSEMSDVRRVWHPAAPALQTLKRRALNHSRRWGACRSSPCGTRALCAATPAGRCPGSSAWGATPRVKTGRHARGHGSAGPRPGVGGQHVNRLVRKKTKTLLKRSGIYQVSLTLDPTKVQKLHKP